jgi:hypothetical protein
VSEVSDTEMRMGRREFTLRGARWFSLALLGGGATFLWWRNGTTDRCRLPLPCASCARNGNCDLIRETPEPPKRNEP